MSEKQNDGKAKQRAAGFARQCLKIAVVYDCLERRAVIDNINDKDDDDENEVGYEDVKKVKFSCYWLVKKQ